MRKVFKPHNGAVTCMAIDGKGELLATASNDNTVFFFYVADDFQPIGFVNIPSAAISLQWSPERNVSSHQPLLPSFLSFLLLSIISPRQEVPIN